MDAYFRNAGTNEYLVVDQGGDGEYSLTMKSTLPADKTLARWYIDDDAVAKGHSVIVSLPRLLTLCLNNNSAPLSENNKTYYPVWAVDGNHLADDYVYKVSKSGSLYTFLDQNNNALGVYAGGTVPNFPCDINGYNGANAYKWVLDPIS